MLYARKQINWVTLTFAHIKKSAEKSAAQLNRRQKYFDAAVR
jgi:hypothetical protein